MKRRDFNIGLLSAMSGALLAQNASASDTASASASDPSQAAGHKHSDATPTKRPTYNMLVHPNMILLDLVAPMTAFKLTMGDVRLVWKDTNPVPTDVGVPVSATHTFDNCPGDADVLFVPGGLTGSTALVEDDETLDFLRQQAKSAKYVTSVCTGSMVLGAAGFLNGKRATSHWYTRDLLSYFGAIPTSQRVVEDGNIITGAGATAGLDFGLTIAARIKGDEWVKKMMLTLEYAPEPPFKGGTPETATPENVKDILTIRGPKIEKASQAIQRAAKKMGV
ncbi:DJ-1/PfpI family protein [Thalassospira lucentensis]|uniref:DJ-1/PfpI family protein n=1 Tax=Thalassospira lucentensis TaxID=168935 RepID=UPI003AA7F5A0